MTRLRVLALFVCTLIWNSNAWGATLTVAAGGDLQAAIDAAQPGDTIVLQAGATFTGPFKLSAKNGSAYITIRSSTGDSQLPPAGTRITPAQAPLLAKIKPGVSGPAIQTVPGASYWRLQFLEVLPGVYSEGQTVGTLIEFGSGGSANQSSLSQVPHHLIIDRCYVHGHPSLGHRRGLALNSANSDVRDSHFSDFKLEGFDTQTILGWNGPGPYLIENNHLEAAGENIMFGGADPHITNLVPSDITIRGNHFYKNPAWKGVWTIKNLLELKSARRLLIENNVFENNWIAAQTGMAIIFKSANDGGTAAWQGTTDVTFRYNIVRNSPQGLAIAAHPETNPAVHVARVRVENNLFYNIGTYNGTSYGRMLILLQDPHDLTIAHNTMIHNYTGDGQMMISDVSYGAARNIVLSNNVATKGGPYGAVMYSGARIGTESLNAFASSYWAFDRNIVIGLDPEFVPWHPQSSYYAGTMAAVGFTNASGGDYSLGSASPYRGKATDGKDPGADFPGLRQRTGSTIVP